MTAPDRGSRVPCDHVDVGLNLVVFRWQPALVTAAARRKARLAIDDVVTALVEHGRHPAVAPLAARAFLGAVARTVGVPGPDGPYLLEQHAAALVFDLPMASVPARVVQIGRLAQQHGLVAVEH